MYVHVYANIYEGVWSAEKRAGEVNEHTMKLKMYILMDVCMYAAAANAQVLQQRIPQNSHLLTQQQSGAIKD